MTKLIGSFKTENNCTRVDGCKNSNIIKMIMLTIVGFLGSHHYGLERWLFHDGHCNL